MVCVHGASMAQFNKFFSVPVTGEIRATAAFVLPLAMEPAKLGFAVPSLRTSVSVCPPPSPATAKLHCRVPVPVRATTLSTYCSPSVAVQLSVQVFPSAIAVAV
jgi:hypothetical protein